MATYDILMYIYMHFMNLLAMVTVALECVCRFYAIGSEPKCI